jgi:hypothetical protein
MIRLKITRTTVAVLLILLQFVAFSGDGDKNKKSAKKSDFCLELNGKISITGQRDVSKYAVYLLLDNTIIDSLTLNEGQNFKFLLKENAWYAVNIKKEGCAPKMLSINTKLPENKYDNVLFKVMFEVDELISHLESIHLDNDALDFPIAIISFDKDSQHFDYSKEYTKNIKKSLIQPVGTR